MGWFDFFTGGGGTPAPAPPPPPAPPTALPDGSTCVTCGSKKEKKKYKSAKDAAVGQLQQYNSVSNADGREYGGPIDQNPDGTYSPGETYRGGPGGVSYPLDSNTVADWHTHPAAPGYDGEGFSSADMIGNMSSHTTGYIGTPSGAIMQFNPNGGAVTTLPETAPVH